MTAHVLVPSLDEERPASLSPVIVDTLLKKTLGYQGVVISDDLGMKAISATTGLGEAAVGAIAAGCDAVLLCNNPIDEQVAALETLIHAVESGQISHHAHRGRDGAPASRERFAISPSPEFAPRSRSSVAGNIGPSPRRWPRGS